MNNVIFGTEADPPSITTLVYSNVIMHRRKYTQSYCVYHNSSKKPVHLRETFYCQVAYDNYIDRKISSKAFIDIEILKN